MLRYDFLNVTGSDSQNTYKVHYEQFYVKYKWLNRGYINYHFMSFSDLELSFWFELRYLKAVFCKFFCKVPFLSSLNFIGIVM